MVNVSPVKMELVPGTLHKAASLHLPFGENSIEQVNQIICIFGCKIKKFKVLFYLIDILPLFYNVFW